MTAGLSRHSPPGARAEAADRVRRRITDPLVLLRRDLIRGLYQLAESGEHLPVNLGNPHEKTLLQLAETVLEVTGSSSEVIFEALPVDDPQVRQPDITRGRQILGWEPRIELAEGPRRTVDWMQPGRRAAEVAPI
jgi:nucleoside-diphosphate-sugar epimerase